jgi:hypothetical protein
MLVGQTHAARRLPPDPPHGGHHDPHDQRNDRNDHQQLYECETASPVHHSTSHLTIRTAPGNYTRFIILQSREIY